MARSLPAGAWASHRERVEHYAVTVLGYDKAQLTGPQGGKIRDYIRRDDEFKFYYNLLREQERAALKGKADLTPNGAYRRSLTQLGYGSEQSPFAPGHTPHIE